MGRGHESVKNIQMHIIPWVLLVPALLPGILTIVLGIFEAFKASLGWMPSMGYDTFSFDAYRQLVQMPGMGSDLAYTLVFGCCVAALCVMIGSFVTWALVRCRSQWVKRWCGVGVVAAIIMPYGVAALATQSFWGQSGLVARIVATLGAIKEPAQFWIVLWTPWGVGLFWPYLWKGTAFVIMVLRPYYERIRNTLEPEARTLGAGGLRLWSTVYVPASALPLALLGSLIFAYSIGGLEVPIWLGALSPRLMPANYYSLLMQPDIKYIPVRMALVLVMAVVGLAGTLLFGGAVYTVLKKGLGYRVPKGPTGFKGIGVWLNTSVLSSYGVLMAVPLLWLLMTGVFPNLRFPEWIPFGEAVHKDWAKAVREPLLFKALIQGLLISGGTGMYTAVSSYFAGRSFVRYSGFKGQRVGQLLAVLPLVLSGVVLVNGAQMAAIGLGIYGTPFAVILCHCALVMPYGIGLQTVYQRQNGVAQEAAARTLGAGGLKLFTKVLIPLHLPGVLLSFMVAFIISFTETFSTQLVGAGQVTTLGSLLGPVLEYGDQLRGSAYMAIFFLVNGLLFYGVHRNGRKREANTDYRSLEEERNAGTE